MRTRLPPAVPLLKDRPERAETISRTGSLDFGDTLDRVALEHALLYALADNVPHRIYAKDIEGRFIFANRAVAAGMGVAGPEDLIGKTDHDFYPAEEANGYSALERVILETRRPLLNHEEHAHYLLLEEDAWLTISKIPMIDAEGRVRGLVGINYDITPQKRAEAALRQANDAAQRSARELQATVDALHREMAERRRFEDKLRFQAQHDLLTGLPNRSLLMDRLDQAIALADRDSSALTLLFLDLDRFKLVNDSFGHATGDDLLKIVTRRISECTRSCDTFARIGGDEFVLLVRDRLPQNQLDELTTRICKAVAEPIVFGGREISVSCSIGCSVFPEDGRDTVTLLKHADAAMYNAKQFGLNTVLRYAAQRDHSDAGEQLALAVQLRRALQRDEFVLHFQPQVDIRTGAIVGMEALIRWCHPERGMVSPLTFIPIAEQTGLIGAIGEWVLRSACRQAAAWNRAGLSPVRMSVNLSARQFQDPSLEALVADALRESGLPAEQLELELTESVSMRNPAETIRILNGFRSLGISLAIDDFGTGYSNLAYLVRFPIQRIKLDRSFVGEMLQHAGSRTIVEAMISMTHKLQMEVVAEGVETLEQYNALAAWECDVVQGYWFSRPLDVAAATRRLETTNSVTC